MPQDDIATTFEDAEAKNRERFGPGYAKVISINLHVVYDEAFSMRDDLNTIETSWTQAMARWDNINDGISWVGRTQLEVEEFQTELDKVRNQIFGTTKDDPANPGKPVLDRPGLYQQVRELALGATQNYDNTDFSVTAMFSQVTANIEDSPYAIGFDSNDDFVIVEPQDGPSGDAPAQTKPPITETF